MLLPAAGRRALARLARPALPAWLPALPGCNSPRSLPDRLPLPRPPPLPGACSLPSPPPSPPAPFVDELPVEVAAAPAPAADDEMAPAPAPMPVEAPVPAPAPAPTPVEVEEPKDGAASLAGHAGLALLAFMGAAAALL